MKTAPALPDVVAHADWGSNPSKRWLAQAVRKHDRYYLFQSVKAGPPDTLLSRLHAADGTRWCVLVGFDFPIGLPAAYARRAGITDFCRFLQQAGRGKWLGFYDVAANPQDVNLGRPFYPQKVRKKGEACQQHLLDGLTLNSNQDLLRACERRTELRKEACPLFWTIGPKQVGKAAISGWRDVLAPAAREGDCPLAIWPFAGTLRDLLSAGGFVIAETYPAEFYHHLGVTFPPARPGSKSGKRVQTDRRVNASILLRRADRLGLIIASELRVQIEDGFGPGPSGEDPFDAVVGLFGMLNVLIGDQPAREPGIPEARTVEGWILGQQAS